MERLRILALAAGLFASLSTWAWLSWGCEPYTLTRQNSRSQRCEAFVPRGADVDDASRDISSQAPSGVAPQLSRGGEGHSPLLWRCPSPSCQAWKFFAAGASSRLAALTYQVHQLYIAVSSSLAPLCQRAAAAFRQAGTDVASSRQLTWFRDIASASLSTLRQNPTAALLHVQAAAEAALRQGGSAAMRELGRAKAGAVIASGCAAKHWPGIRAALWQVRRMLVELSLNLEFSGAVALVCIIAFFGQRWRRPHAGKMQLGAPQPSTSEPVATAPREAVDVPPPPADLSGGPQPEIRPFCPRSSTVPRSGSPQRRSVSIDLTAADSELTDPVAPQESVRTMAIRDFWAFVEQSSDEESAPQAPSPVPRAPSPVPRVSSPVPRASSPVPRTPLRQLDFSDSTELPTGTTQQSQGELLSILNEAESPEIQRLHHMGEKTARAIVRYRRKGQALTCVSELVTKVGLNKGHVTRFMREYGLCD